MDKATLIKQLRDEAANINKAADLLEAGGELAPAYPRPGEKKRTGSRVVSAATREKLSLAQKERWAKLAKKKPVATNKKK